MRFLEKMCFIVLASGLALGQGTAQSSGSNSSGTVSDELKALREAISEQQKQISQQQQQIQTLQQQLQDKAKPQQQPVATVTPRSNDNSARVVDASLHTTPVAATTVTQETERPKESPLSFRIGNTDFTPGGFVDFENV
ncbi:MAG TPA: hypothetical protein VFB79_22945, partial [Candidatus Angelobacter sp.]|nr:hypothetical protein [Candidatus Angelobacter sp.]